MGKNFDLIAQAVDIMREAIGEELKDHYDLLDDSRLEEAAKMFANVEYLDEAVGYLFDACKAIDRI